MSDRPTVGSAILVYPTKSSVTGKICKQARFDVLDLVVHKANNNTPKFNQILFFNYLRISKRFKISSIFGRESVGVAGVCMKCAITTNQPNSYNACMVLWCAAVVMLLAAKVAVYNVIKC